MKYKKNKYKKPLIKENKVNILSFTVEDLLARGCCGVPGCPIMRCEQCISSPFCICGNGTCAN